MNRPSHHQSAFFSALNARDDVALKIRYFNPVSEERIKEGWNSKYIYKPYEACVVGAITPQELLSTVENYAEHIHLISKSFNAELVNYFCSHNIKWCHWSEKPGIKLAQRFNYNVWLFHIVYACALLMKRDDGKQIAQHAEMAFCHSTLAKDAYSSMGVPSKKLSLLHYALAPLDYLPPYPDIMSFKKNRNVFLCVASLYKGKGIDLLLKAFKRLCADDWCLVFCGSDKCDALYQRMAKSLGIDDKVLFINPVPSTNISSIYTASDVLVLPSRWDGWGAVLNEAASLGLPLIGTDMCGASWHLIREGRNGFKVKAGSIHALQKAMQVYVDSPELCKQHGHESRKLFFEEFTPEKNADRLLNALQQVPS